ncbi:MAG: DEAD/DEAH box helicase [Leptospiraceae bacterium]|nr:DEAD/DEAH box helicase [Leptospiraceae bacterium]
MQFNQMGLSVQIQKALSDEGYTSPTPIQSQVIPAILQDQDVLAAAQTGTGKTAGFTLPVLQKLSAGPSAPGQPVRALILTPTRELAAQVHASVETYGRYLNVGAAVVFGGVNINPQIKKLRQGVDVLVATPGRLLDLYQQKAVHFKSLEVLILDEADRMLDMGFIHDIRKILARLPKDRQTLLFSATFSDPIRKLARSILIDPTEISVSPPNSTIDLVTQSVYAVDKNQKSRLLQHLIAEHHWNQVLVFSRTKHGANKLARFLETQAIKAAAIHGNKSQAARTKALADFKSLRIQVLVATDIAARGLDIDQLPQVVNFDLPHVPEDYVHRIGRTGRAGSPGEAVSLVCLDEYKQLQSIERLIGLALERREAPGFKPTHPLPAAGQLNRQSKAAPAKKDHQQQSRPHGGYRGKQAPRGDRKKGPGSRRPTRSSV